MEKIKSSVGKSEVIRVEPFTYENIAEYVSNIAAISRGKDSSKNPKARFKALLKEAANATASRCLEFVPVVMYATVYKDMVVMENTFEEGKHPVTINSILDFYNKIVKYSYVEQDKFSNDASKLVVYTNYRTLLNSGYFTLDNIGENTRDELENYVVVRIKCSYFTWAQLMTHTQLSKVSQSDRVAESNEYWLPDDILHRCIKHKDKISRWLKYDIDHDWVWGDDKNLTFLEMLDLRGKGTKDIDIKNKLLQEMLGVLSQNECQDLLQELDYKREIFSRAPYYFKMKTFFMGGWKNDPNVWDNLFLERGVFPERWKTWVQQDCREVATMIKDAVYN